MSGSNRTLSECVATIVSAYVAKNVVRPRDLANLVGDVQAVLANLGSTEAQPPAPPLVPAVPIDRSITSEFLVCLEDGRQFRSLKRHLHSQYKLTPDQYRLRWQLPADYPMVASVFSQQRSKQAKSMSLGRKAGASLKKRKPAKPHF